MDHREFSKDNLDKFFEDSLRRAYEGRYSSVVVIAMNPEEATEEYGEVSAGYAHCRASDITRAIGVLEKMRFRIWLAEMREDEDEDNGPTRAED